MAYITTALGMKLADPATIQAFETAQVNANFEILEDEVGLWVSYTPTITASGLVLGNAAVSGQYRKRGKTVEFWVRFVMGSTSTMGSSLSIGLPPGLTMSTPLAISGVIGDSGSADYVALITPLTSTSLKVTALNVAGTYGLAATVTPTVPMTWTTNDGISVGGFYQAV